MAIRRSTLLFGAGLLAVALWLGACASASRTVTIRPRALRYTAAFDSVGLAAFDSLTTSEQRRRRAAAASWRGVADDAPTAESRLRALRNVAGLTPDDGEAWLDLAEVSRWFGWRRETGSMLAASLETSRRLDGPQRNDLRRRIAMLRAWIVYDRGQWRQGLALVDSVSELEGQEREAMLVRGLLLAGSGRNWDAVHVAAQLLERETGGLTRHWIRGMADYFRDRPEEALQQFGGGGDRRHDTTRRNDLGMVAEAFGRREEAVRAYEHAFEALPFGESITVRRHEPVLSGFQQRYGRLPVPVWLVFDRHYVVGSHLTAAEMHYWRYLAASEGAGRESWGDLVMDETEICIRKHIEPTRMRAMRGRVQLDQGLFGLAEASLRRADTEYRRLGRGPDLEVLGDLAHLLVVGERHHEAIPLLEEYVELNDSRASVWSDLGYARIIRNDLPGARHALDRSIELDPDAATAWYNRGMLFFNLQQWQQAIADFECAASLAPGNEAVVEILQRARLALRRENVEKQ